MAWRREHPKTTVLNMSRTNRNYTREFYRRPADFVLGWEIGGKTYHCRFDVLDKAELLNLTLGGKPLLLGFDRASSSSCSPLGGGFL